MQIFFSYQAKTSTLSLILGKLTSNLDIISYFVFASLKINTGDNKFFDFKKDSEFSDSIHAKEIGLELKVNFNLISIEPKN